MPSLRSTNSVREFLFLPWCIIGMKSLLCHNGDCDDSSNWGTATCPVDIYFLCGFPYDTLLNAMIQAYNTSIETLEALWLDMYINFCDLSFAYTCTHFPKLGFHLMLSVSKRVLRQQKRLLSSVEYREDLRTIFTWLVISRKKISGTTFQELTQLVNTLISREKFRRTYIWTSQIYWKERKYK